MIKTAILTSVVTLLVSTLSALADNFSMCESDYIVKSLVTYPDVNGPYKIGAMTLAEAGASPMIVGVIGGKKIYGPARITTPPVRWSLCEKGSSVKQCGYWEQNFHDGWERRRICQDVVTEPETCEQAFIIPATLKCAVDASQFADFSNTCTSTPARTEIREIPC